MDNDDPTDANVLGGERGSKSVRHFDSQARALSTLPGAQDTNNSSNEEEHLSFARRGSREEHLCSRCVIGKHARVCARVLGFQKALTHRQTHTPQHTHTH